MKKTTVCTVDGMIGKDFPCDVLVASCGLTPAAGPLFLAQAKMAYDFFTGFFLPEQLPPKVHAAGRLLGLTDSLSIEASGHLAGISASADCGAPVATGLKQAREKLDQLPGPARGRERCDGG